ncbi:SAM-dependent methyltransferase [Pseudoclavibacter sp. RFBJ3]|uniref:DUF7059 domain-containing protein n=1 Tax=unclassified Pseudoclavibacter TaxID=2615177 RepID=UPI000CE92256|nr:MULTISPECIES: methyltransferase [unclassified Pseudoclavibacter]PPF81417.1 SAM-dependent methyltransferase [Pseudoclavibacter sp. RFBJ5]PPF90748.1 SAM-dependent methyltransferase [Pseudoclavibacter sp. RFBJ3]PPG00621.1 SAM-dependent methyltransferase [Pseudoclavibacter sp. RFBH5]PPG21044.1 SAM-dependent methyltransferase [Pseudoclavibacter sp. RFBI4]
MTSHARHASSASTPDDFTFDDPSDAPDSTDEALLRALAVTFAGAGFTVDGVESRLGAEAADALHRDLLEPASFALSREPDDALSALIRLFVLAETVEAGDVPALDKLLAARLVARVPRLSPTESAQEASAEELADELVVALVDVRPYASEGVNGSVEMWVASDLGGVQLGRDQPLRRDHVVGIGPATTLLAQLTPREPVARALDLGVGMGVQTMHLLAHTRHVVATDISERALAFAKFNLLLNAEALGIAPGGLEDRVSLRLGNMLEPVAGEHFDLFVSNPPFVITPRREGEGGSDQYTYRDGGKPGDSIVEGLVRDLGTVLAPGGVACMLGNWEVREGDANWHSRLETWPANDVDLWVVQREDATPVEYADMWLKDAAENAELSSWQHAFRRYLQDFASRDVERIGMGMFFLRRTHEGAVGGPLRRFEHLTHALGHPLAAHIRDGFEAITWLRGVDDDELFDEPLVVAADVTEERHSRPGDEDPSIIMLRQGAGFRRTMSMSTELTGFVSVCDGELVGSQIVTAIASLVDVEEEALRASLVPDVRELVALGFLEPRWR